jgi:hypothetical protein
MSLSADEIRQVDQREPGWENVFDKLWVALHKRLNEIAPSLLQWSNSDHDPREFVSDMLFKYRERAGNGLLLALYDPNRGDVVAFLTSRRTMKCRALDWLQLRYRHHGTIRDTMSAQPEVAPERHAVIHRIRQALDQIVLDLPEGIVITSDIEQVGLQLFPRLDWTLPSLNRVWCHLRSKINVAGFSDPKREVCSAHESSQGEIARQIVKTNEELSRTAPGTNEHSRFCKRLLKLEFRRFLMPLEAGQVARLLNIGLNPANIRLTRYRKRLPELLQELNELAFLATQLQLE